MVDLSSESTQSITNNLESVVFRPLKENEIRLLFALWQLTYINNELQVTSDVIIEKSGLNNNQFSVALRDLWQISKDCYVKSTRGAIGKLATYSIIDNKIISTSSTAKMILKLHSVSTELRIKKQIITNEVVNFFGSDEKFNERLNWLISCRYLRNEEKGVYVFCERFNSEILWINKIASFNGK